MVKGRFDRLFIKAGIWTGTGLLGILAISLGLSTWKVYQKERVAAASYEDAVATRTQLTEEATSLTAQVAGLGTDRGVEGFVREHYPLAKPGEEVIVLVDATSATPAPVAPPQGVWGTIKGWLGL